MSRSRLVLMSALVSALLALAIGSGASSASRPARSSAAGSLVLRFILQMPSGAPATVTFKSGVQGINSQIAGSLESSAGAMRFFSAYWNGFSITGVGPSLGARIDIDVQPTAGSSVITGQTVLPQGATLTVQVNNGPAIPLGAAFTIPLSTLAQAPAAGPCDSPGAIIGTDGNDVLAGTEGADVIIARGGNDLVRGKGGHDSICAGLGNDTIQSGAGHDLVLAGPGNDTVMAGSGHDQVLAGAGNDLVRGGPGHDHLTLGPGRDRGYGDAGHDAVVGDSSDTLAGGAGADQVSREGR